MTDVDYAALIAEGRIYPKQRVAHRLADAVETLLGIEQRLTDHIVQLSSERDALQRKLDAVREERNNAVQHAARNADERDALRAQLDTMTVEKATVPQFVTDKDTGDNRLDLLPRPRGHFEFPLMKRLVGPWVESVPQETSSTR